MCHALFVFVFTLHYETYESCRPVTICVFDALYVRLSHSGILCIRLGSLCLAIFFGAVQGHEQTSLGDLRQQGESQQADAERTLGSYIHKPGSNYCRANTTGATKLHCHANEDGASKTGTEKKGLA